VQTVVHSILGRIHCPLPIGERCAVNLADGSTLTYDVYEPLEAKSIPPEGKQTLFPFVHAKVKVVRRKFINYNRTFYEPADGANCNLANFSCALSHVKKKSDHNLLLIDFLLALYQF